MRQQDLEGQPSRKPEAGSLAATRRAKRITNDDLYQYENIVHLPPGAALKQGAYTVAAGRSHAFISFNRKGFDIDAQSTRLGWKFHISLDDENFENVAKGWNVIYKILMKFEVNSAKVIKNGVKLAQEDENQRGKQITIYQHFNPELPWQKIIQEITVELTKSRIRPGYAPPSDYPIKGTNYVYYRNDAAQDTSKYKKGADVPTEHSKEFDSYEFEVANQPPVKEWGSKTELKLSK